MHDLSHHLRQAIQGHINEQLTARELFRCLMSYPSWYIPTALDETGEPQLLSFSSMEGERWLKVFSDPSAIEDSTATSGLEFEDNWIVTPGYLIFGVLDDDLAGIEINPETPSAIHYVQEQIPKLRQWARSVRIETALSTIDATETPLGYLKEFDGYIVVLKKLGEGVQLALAPDQEGRRLAAVFTAEDTLEAFLETTNPGKEAELFPIRLNGSQLFTQLREMSLDGAVFNCCGPIPAKAFGKKLAEYVLSAEEP